MAQDGLTHGPIGLFGMIKTIIGYSAAAVSTYVEASYPGARAVLAALFYLLHQILFWMIEGSLLGGRVVFDPAQTVILAAIHAGLAILLFGFFDRLQRTSG
jgi:rod shape-determining protein MreD